jgi:membrane protein
MLKRLLPALWYLLKTTAADWWNDNTFRLAASLAFYTIFSLAPVLLIAIAITGFVFGRDAAAEQIVQQFQNLIGQQGGAAIGQLVSSASTGKGGIIPTVIGIVALLIGPTAVFAELQSALNQIWDVQADPKRGVILGLLTDRLRSFAIVLGVGFLLLVSLAFSAALAAAEASVAARCRKPTAA